MSDATADDLEEVKKPSKLPLILGLVAAIAGGGGGFYATYSGMILGAESTAEPVYDEPKLEPLADVDFVAMPALTISLGADSSAKHLRFTGQLEVPSEYKSDVEKLMPRIVDVLNSYLRALRPSDVEAPAALVRLRAQMLRRVQIVTGKGRVNDLLVMEFLLN